MPELDGVSIIALGSFVLLAVSWLFVPSGATTTVRVTRESPVAERAAA